MTKIKFKHFIAVYTPPFIYERNEKVKKGEKAVAQLMPKDFFSSLYRIQLRHSLASDTKPFYAIANATKGQFRQTTPTNKNILLIYH